MNKLILRPHLVTHTAIKVVSTHVITAVESNNENKSMKKSTGCGSGGGSALMDKNGKAGPVPGERLVFFPR